MTRIMRFLLNLRHPPYFLYEGITKTNGQKKNSRNKSKIQLIRKCSKEGRCLQIAHKLHDDQLYAKAKSETKRI